ncbi:hypothetical protein [Saccharothrix yanglingensis]|uniref:Uncharacterized protein n=1 Tax=Saccharothrix yanglingensis TaxID=659496 RepID=A0ABU0X0Y3_9PSEU|nr:hypothetical protein [Saccharothrix yanglingensis]MDQ2584939.1 hypothetical protein [Saccharothrix yanglingensis]
MLDSSPQRAAGGPWTIGCGTPWPSTSATTSNAVSRVRRVFDTEAIADRYRAFIARRDRLGLVRQDPHLPAEHLDED